LVCVNPESLQFDEHIKIFNQFSEIQKDKHHISWKNHNIDSYIAEAMKEYLKKQEKSK